MPKFRKNFFFKETCAIMASTRGFGFKNRNFGGFFPGQRSQKPFLDGAGQCCCIISANMIIMSSLLGILMWLAALKR
jgi:hypothetical protein